MLGDKGKAGTAAGEEHRGSMCKTKAAETRLMLRYALDALERFQLPKHHNHLVRAGRALAEYADITSEFQGVRVPIDMRTRLTELAIESLSRMRKAGIGYVPKLHALVHMTHRFP